MVNKQNISYHTDKILDKRYHINGANETYDRVCNGSVKREKRRLLENKIIQLKEDCRSSHSHNLFNTVHDLGKNQGKSIWL